MASIRPGQYVHLVYILNPVITVTMKGDTEYTYPMMPNIAPPASIPQGAIQTRCSIEPVLGRELVVAKGIKPDITTKIRMWYNKNLLAASQIAWWDTKLLAPAYRIFACSSPISIDYLNRELWFYATEISR